MDRIGEIDDHHMLEFVVGSNKLISVGKTDDDIELMVPADLAKGLVYYHFIKSCLGQDHPKDRFFVDTENIPVNIKNFYETYIYADMCHEMGVKKLRFTDQRHINATSMLCSNTQGQNTGMAH
jgi:hypothetical protein